MSSIQHELKIAAPQSAVVEALTTDEHLARWHGAKVTEDAGVVRLEYPSGVIFRWHITSPAPNRVIWRCVEGPGKATGTEAVFLLSDAGGGRTLVQFEHSGWSANDPSYRKCNTFWGFLLHQLQQHLVPSQTHMARL
jgi:uncharacterized protein YndB with AHSA1/START domain